MVSGPQNDVLIETAPPLPGALFLPFPPFFSFPETTIASCCIRPVDASFQPNGLDLMFCTANNTHGGSSLSAPAPLDVSEVKKMEGGGAESSSTSSFDFILGSIAGVKIQNTLL